MSDYFFPCEKPIPPNAVLWVSDEVIECERYVVVPIEPCGEWRIVSCDCPE